MNIKNKWFLLLAGLLSFALLLGAACGGDDDDEGDGGGGPAATEPSGTGDDMAPADQQKLVMQTIEPEFYDPHRSNFEQDIGVERMIFRGLYNLKDDGAGGVEVEPMMAAGEPTVNGNEYTVKLKPDLKWSDGEPLTAKDFVYGIQRACSKATAGQYQYLLGAGFLDVVGCDDLLKNEDPAQEDALLAAVGVKAVDDTTLVFTLNQPNGRFTTITALWVTFPARQDIIEEFGDKWTDPANIVSNGPYILTEVVPTDHFTLKVNPNWTAGKTPAIQEITGKFISDFSASFRAYQTGELQMGRIQETDVVTVKGGEFEDELLIVPSSRIETVHMYAMDEILKDFNVRLALSRSIDRETLNDVVYDGVNEPATYWIVKGLKGHQGNEAFDDIIGYDPDAAKAALAEAGYPDGAGFPTLSMVMRDDALQRNLFDFLAKGWKDVLGITVEAEFVDGQTRSARYNAEDYQLFRGGWQLDYPDIENPLLGLYNTGGGNNHYGCSDPEIDAAFQEAIDATSDDARIAAYQKVETLVVTKLCGVAPIAQLAQPFLVSSKIGGVEANGTLIAGQPGGQCPECWFVRK